ncbi:cytochrome c biogenesis heme-transporting ATPase CcmA [Agaribacter flavus]|uniref:Cytochrome c biogenesis heme-transporting ATPase CcmA n=1 Tax=Agaribacter flavus TaxID=1902781 RepID=A0ABV7FRR6_9ALTE
MGLLQLQDISCEKQDRVLFANLSLTLAKGELLFLKGENGAGKTSLLRIMVGLSKPQRGKVYFDGVDLTEDMSVCEKLIYCGHKLGLNASLNPVENLMFWSNTHGHNASLTELEDILEQLGLFGMEDLPLRQLSAGQQRRVSLAKLWINTHAKLWVLDEPFTALDKQTVELLENKLDSFVESGGSVVLTSHQQASLNCKQREWILEYLH